MAKPRIPRLRDALSDEESAPWQLQQKDGGGRSFRPPSHATVTAAFVAGTAFGATTVTAFFVGGIAASLLGLAWGLERVALFLQRIVH